VYDRINLTQIAPTGLSRIAFIAFDRRNAPLAFEFKAMPSTTDTSTRPQPTKKTNLVLGTKKPVRQFIGQPDWRMQPKLARLSKNSALKISRWSGPTKMAKSQITCVSVARAALNDRHMLEKS